jgi:hypothetical protein
MVTAGPIPAESGSVKTSSIIIPIHYWSVSLTMSGCWQLCSPDALRAPDNSIVCHDFASRCRPRLSVAQDVVSPAGGACKSRGSLTRSSFLSRRQHEDPGGPRRFATAAPWGTDAAHHLGWPIEVHRHTGPEVVGIVLRCGPRRLAGDNGSFSVAHRGPRTSSVQKNPRPDSDSTVERRDAGPRYIEPVYCPGSFPSTRYRSADWCGNRRP